MPDGCSGDVNNNGANTKCLNSSCIAGVVSASTGKGADSGSGHSSSSSSSSSSSASSKSGILSLGSNNECNSPRRVQVTAKILFGSVNAISDMKQSEKLQKKRSK